MRFIIDTVIVCAVMGASAFLEHPAFPVWIASKRPSSIWTSRAKRWLKRLQCVQFVTFDQCLFRCEARKPTTLLLLQIVSIWADLGAAIIQPDSIKHFAAVMATVHFALR